MDFQTFWVKILLLVSNNDIFDPTPFTELILYSRITLIIQTLVAREFLPGGVKLLARMTLKKKLRKVNEKQNKVGMPDVFFC